jgi:Winged helix DNA-binding domain
VERPLTGRVTLRALNRATLARQLLLARERASVVEAVERLAGMQAQEPRPPFVGLWTRLEGFERADLLAALRERTLVRATWLRATLHLTSARDYLAFRMALEPMLERAMRGFGAKVQVEELLPVARRLVEQRPRTFNELRGLLAEAFPRVNERALGYIVRLRLPLVMVATDDERWGFPSVADFTLADAWLGARPAKDDSPHELVRRYLAAFGPATAADVQTWSGLQGIRGVLAELRKELHAVTDEGGRTLLDLPDAPRPDQDAPAPVRFLPAFDNLLLSHADRTRVLADGHRAKVITRNLRVHPTFLVDGFVAGTWEIERKRATATLRLSPFAALPRRAAKALGAEGERLLRFAEEDATTWDVRVD